MAAGVTTVTAASDVDMPAMKMMAVSSDQSWYMHPNKSGDFRNGVPDRDLDGDSYSKKPEPWSRVRALPMSHDITMAEGVGFEPTETQNASTVFETGPFVRSGTLPPDRLAGSREQPDIRFPLVGPNSHSPRSASCHASNCRDTVNFFPSRLLGACRCFPCDGPHHDRSQCWSDQSVSCGPAP